MQIIIVSLILILAVIYVGRRIYNTFRKDNGICSGCSLIDICKKKNNKKKLQNKKAMKNKEDIIL